MNDKKMLKNAFERLIIITLLAVFLAMLCLSVLNDMYAFVRPSGSVSVTVLEPTPLYEFSNTLSKQGIISNPTVFYLYIKAKGRGERLESFVGEATLGRDMSYREIMLALS